MFKFMKKKKLFFKLPLIIRQQRRINTLELEKETLEMTIKEELYKAFMKKLNEPLEVERLRKENKKLRIKNKELKEELYNGYSHKERK
ncbi:MAG: hypothetical protein IJW82_02225 [Clostridia bacterium]|nr:hypothetical protein [Clostridia bacterium]